MLACCSQKRHWLGSRGRHMPLSSPSWSVRCRRLVTLWGWTLSLSHSIRWVWPQYRSLNTSPCKTAYSHGTTLTRWSCLVYCIKWPLCVLSFFQVWMALFHTWNYVTLPIIKENYTNLNTSVLTWNVMWGLKDVSDESRFAVSVSTLIVKRNPWNKTTSAFTVAVALQRVVYSLKSLFGHVKSWHETILHTFQWHGNLQWAGGIKLFLSIYDLYPFILNQGYFYWNY